MTAMDSKPVAEMIALLRDKNFRMSGGSQFALEIVAAIAAPPSDAAMTALKERCDSAEQCMLMLTADHNSGPHYVRGFDMANKHFGTYTEPAAGHSADNASLVSNEKEITGFGAILGTMARESGSVAWPVLDREESDTALLRQCLEALEGVARWVELRPKQHPYDAWQAVEAAIAAARQALGKP